MSDLTSEELTKFKNTLEQKKAKLTKSQAHMQQEDPFNDAERVSDNAASDVEAQEQEGHARLEALESEVEETLEMVEQALMRIEEGTYGKCLNCGNRINLERLEIDPTVTQCVTCAKGNQ